MELKLEPAESLLSIRHQACFCSSGYLICLLLALGWALASYVRNREIRQQKKSMRGGNSFAFLSHNIADLEHSNQVNLPKVSVVMPLKGFREHNLLNWRSQITSLYRGPLEFIFVVESTEDPAYRAVKKLLANHEFVRREGFFHKLLGTSPKTLRDEVDAKVIVAGLSTTCSQKIHNQLVGVEKFRKIPSMCCFLTMILGFILGLLELSPLRWRRTLMYGHVAHVLGLWLNGL